MSAVAADRSKPLPKPAGLAGVKHGVKPVGPLPVAAKPKSPPGDVELVESLPDTAVSSFYTLSQH